MNTIVIRGYNKFHYSRANIRVKVGDDGTIFATKRQVRTASKKMCSVHGCMCPEVFTCDGEPVEFELTRDGEHYWVYVG